MIVRRAIGELRTGCSPRCSPGRRTDRKLPLAVFERLICGNGTPEIRTYWEQFHGADALLDWAYGHPLSNRRGGSKLSSVYETLWAMLERNDPQVVVVQNIAALRHLAAAYPNGDIGRYACVDGTDIEAHCDQHQGLNDAEEALINRGTDARYLEYEGQPYRRMKWWRGYKLIVVSDMKSTLPMVWTLVPANESEYRTVRGLLDLLFEHWSECPLEFLVSDREFDREEALAADLEFRYGVHPVFPLRENISAKLPWAATDGVPHCSQHGEMKLKDRDGFFGPKGRLREGIRRGELPTSAKAARHRWFCQECGVTETTYTKNNARLYPFLPRQGDHRDIGRRHALAARLNTAETINAVLKAWGTGLGSQRHAKWKPDRWKFDWWTGGCLASMTFRRLAHETGAYRQAFEEAVERGLLKVPKAELL